MPKNGSPVWRANRTASIFPSIPRLSNPPGTRSPSTPASDFSAPSAASFSESIRTTRTLALCAMPAWSSASYTLLYASRCFTYLPTNAIVTSCAGTRMLSSICRQSLMSNGFAWVSDNRSTMSASSLLSASDSGTS